MRKSLTALLVCAALVGASGAVEARNYYGPGYYRPYRVAPYRAWNYGYRGWHNHGYYNNWAAPLALGLGALALGAAIASPYYYAPPPAYYPPPYGAYYAPSPYYWRY